MRDTFLIYDIYVPICWRQVLWLFETFILVSVAGDDSCLGLYSKDDERSLSFSLPCKNRSKKGCFLFFLQLTSYSVISLSFQIYTHTHTSPDSFQQTDRKYCAPVNRSVRPYNANMDGAGFYWLVHNNAWEIRAGFTLFIFVTFNAVVDRK